MDAKKIKPLGDKILVQRCEAQATKGGIILPDTAKEKPREGKVVATGPGRRDDDGRLTPLGVSVGDCVMFSSYAGTEVKEAGEEGEYLILAESDVYGVVTR
ncbi:co-chaperone GroES [Simkania negevensis]|uniref:Co-chaperonin GroES n=1 Tax=Simkania negevensis TaxID=83561 RepID=A0ABS3ARI5_9BACT|nr:co-chaperone GroES [Simkania negevensis]